MELVGGRGREKFTTKNNPILFVETILPILGGVLGTKPETISDAVG